MCSLFNEFSRQAAKTQIYEAWTRKFYFHAAKSSQTNLRVFVISSYVIISSSYHHIVVISSHLLERSITYFGTRFLPKVVINFEYHWYMKKTHRSYYHRSSSPKRNEKIWKIYSRKLCFWIVCFINTQRTWSQILLKKVKSALTKSSNLTDISQFSNCFCFSPQDRVTVQVCSFIYLLAIAHWKRTLKTHC